jgi:hypothetical protein
LRVILGIWSPFEFIVVVSTIIVSSALACVGIERGGGEEVRLKGFRGSHEGCIGSEELISESQSLVFGNIRTLEFLDRMQGLGADLLVVSKSRKKM